MTEKWKSSRHGGEKEFRHISVHSNHRWHLLDHQHQTLPKSTYTNQRHRWSAPTSEPPTPYPILTVQRFFDHKEEPSTQPYSSSYSFNESRRYSYRKSFDSVDDGEYSEQRVHTRDRIHDYRDEELDEYHSLPHSSSRGYHRQVETEDCGRLYGSASVRPTSLLSYHGDAGVNEGGEVNDSFDYPSFNGSLQWQEGVAEEPKQYQGNTFTGKGASWRGNGEKKSNEDGLIRVKSPQRKSGFCGIQSEEFASSPASSKWDQRLPKKPLNSKYGATTASHTTSASQRLPENTVSAIKYIGTHPPRPRNYTNDLSFSSSSSPSSFPPFQAPRQAGVTNGSSIPLSSMGIKVVAIDCEMVGCVEVNLPRANKHAILDRATPIDHVLHKKQMKPTSQKGKKKRVPMVREISVAGRCSVVDYEGAVLYDSFIMPHLQILSLRTRYSGIRRKDLQGAPPFHVAQSDVLRLLDGCVVVGHAIKNDLDALEISLPSEQIRDTSVYKPLRGMARLSVGQPPSLKKLAKILLGRNIQKGSHCSLEDARATMEIYRVAEVQWESSQS